MILSKTIGTNHDCQISIELHDIHNEADIETIYDNLKIYFNDTNVTQFFELIPVMMDDLIASVDWYELFADANYENQNRDNDYDY